MQSRAKKPRSPEPAVPASAKPRRPARVGALRAARSKSKRLAVAAGLVAGETRAQIGKRSGLSVRSVTRVASRAETRLVMAELIRAHREKIVALVAKSVDVIEQSLEAHHVYVTKDGVVVDAGGDTFARLAAVKRLLELIEASRPGQDEGQVKVTWEMFLDLYREANPEFRG